MFTKTSDNFVYEYIKSSLQNNNNTDLTVQIGVVMWVPLMDTQQFFIKAPARSIITKYEQGGENN